MTLLELNRAHLQDCIAIDADSPHPWGESHWARSLRDDHCLGLCLDSHLLAVSAYSLVFDELSLLNIVVADNQKGRGYGQALLEQGLEWMQQFGPARCILEVRVSNLAARRLYKRLGFGEDGLRKNYYPLGTGREDAMLMSVNLPLEY
ncbi:ribosomal-protein-alanine acetyltransferase [Spongiibacter sp. IMCC21906]|jgi:ribosomal-protein-alanine N-acetyltransferase|uniref:ribosomal protein S18-alanine N-acetyltransferase n=1 Tax=Spongiibacter sp. IMCC21906 TaxID=1620392 RepID=UPI00062DEBBC|nr:ribosomal protein S18-alanine N-acetyltransferase [Spongiibacter sp. IMCC21906]AKH69095.1 ribosomal-protein-alanine acetyltransferase [Spongiibacter sp. IMCC21906]